MDKYLLIAFALCFSLSGLSVVEQKKTPTASAPKTAIYEPWLRTSTHVANIKIDPKARYLAFTDTEGQNLRIMSLKTKSILEITKHQVDLSYFWAPAGARLFYRKIYKDLKDRLYSSVHAFDVVRRSVTDVASYPHETGFLSFDPRDLRIHLAYRDGVHSQQIYFPDQRLARWQIALRRDFGRWVPTQTGIYWLTDGGFTMQKMKDDGTPPQSYDISPDGSRIVWATKGENIYVSEEGTLARKIAHGFDPKWHPVRPIFAYAAARRVGAKTISIDLRINDEETSGRYLTSTQSSNERWPTWHPNGREIYFTIENSTDIHKLEFKDAK